MNTLHRIKEYIDYKGLTNQSFEKKVGFSNGAFASQLKKNRTIGVDKLENILIEFPDINPIWILTGEGEMLKVKSSMNIENNFSLRTDINVSQQKIPLYNIEATAGLIPLFDNRNQIETDEYISIPHAPRCDGALFVTGDSMYPLLKSGDIVAYQKVHDKANYIFWGEMYLLSIDMGGEEYVSVKYVQKSDKGEEFIKLVSENRHHQPQDVHVDDIRALALVKASVRINSM